MNLQLNRVKYIPTELASGVLYLSDKFGVAVHLCVCGCGNKVVTPLGPTEWQCKVVNGKATLHPSIGNWQFPCQSHYWIQRGEIIWSRKWSKEEIEQGRKAEEEFRNAYFKRANKKKKSFIHFIKSLFG